MQDTAAIITIGNEILAGDIVNNNATWLAKELQGLGVEVKAILTIPDEIPIVEEYIRTWRFRYDYLFITGGVGPTPDDITRQAVAKGLDLDLVLHPEAEAILREHFGEKIDPVRLAMAKLPQGAVINIGGERSLFPGFFIENLFIFPGIPRLMERIFSQIREKIRREAIGTLSFTTQRLESDFALTMEEAMRRFPDVSIGSYPSVAGEAFTARLVLRSKSPEILQEAREWLEREING